MKETFENKKVTYTLTVNDKVYIVENVPARVCCETNEEFFAPETVEHLQTIIQEKTQPKRIIETPVFDYAA